MDLIIYGSKYGHTKAYAEEYSKRTGIPCENYCDVVNIDNLSTVIYFGALYAGGVMGLKKTLDKISVDDKRIIVVTVGLSDPDDEHNISNIENSMKQQLTAELFNKLEIYHLRGGID
ncbi:MAG: flavodoxin domain-containing protein, partial [Erysipelotrichaceae bacterium]